MTSARGVGGYYDALLEDDPEELYEAAPCGYVSTTPSGMITKANRTFLTWLGYEADELVHRERFQRLLAVGDRIYYETHFAPSLAMQGSVREIAVELVTAAGTRLPVLLNAAMKTDAAGEPVAVRIAVFDARERRSYERELVAARLAAEEAAERARSLAETLQRTLLPPTNPRIEHLDFGGTYRPAGDGTVVGGDFYDVFQTQERGWGVVLGDVCGKGASAAVTTALARYTVRASAMRTSQPSVVLRELHDVLESSGEGTFLTAVYAIIRTQQGRAEVDFATGGHGLPLLLRDGQVGEVGRSGSLLGMLGPPRLHDTALVLGPGDTLVLYTDGVTEARAGDAFFGYDRLCELIARLRDEPAQGIADGIAGAAVEFQDGHTRDDIAVVVVQVPRA